eukprot:841033-Prorocentrum_minimum.AAC.1
MRGATLAARKRRLCVSLRGDMGAAMRTAPTRRKTRLPSCPRYIPPRQGGTHHYVTYLPLIRVSERMPFVLHARGRPRARGATQRAPTKGRTRLWAGGGA